MSDATPASMRLGTDNEDMSDEHMQQALEFLLDANADIEAAQDALHALRTAPDVANGAILAAEAALGVAITDFMDTKTELARLGFDLLYDA